MLQARASKVHIRGPCSLGSPRSADQLSVTCVACVRLTLAGVEKCVATCSAPIPPRRTGSSATRFRFWLARRVGGGGGARITWFFGRGREERADGG
ncbi:hypothetical protein CC78DRAFT_43665 [Lojkania enalia]|uniref:Uncharacterized protein n=1 Tax=Lojkania enalia TaxID=147567 RepID=A0A9P4K0U3_9PLEO|nr:hypothetical protein CC78DRAFT_43665 [Didymosphaeria enalia]